MLCWKNGVENAVEPFSDTYFREIRQFQWHKPKCDSMQRRRDFCELVLSIFSFFTAAESWGEK